MAVWRPPPRGASHRFPATTAPATAQHHQPPPPSTAAPPAPRPTGRPLHQVQFPPSPSPLPAWAAGSSSGPVYTTAPEHPAPSLPFERSSSSAPYAPELPDPAYAMPSTAAATGHGGPTPPRFAKLNFTTYEGTEDPLNWLNQCEQFFRGQRTLASDRTWLASYHLRGAAQTWYYASATRAACHRGIDFASSAFSGLAPPSVAADWLPSAAYRLHPRSRTTPTDSKPWRATHQAYPRLSALSSLWVVSRTIFAWMSSSGNPDLDPPCTPEPSKAGER
ncbi:hypothetical protein ZWY2020_019217 [Hordeum vulgare]|nr:hypothetical protein ZWY2020_019217 [Hordeum vulgare]